ncbi:hypothetical protein AAG570_002279 [Ranatra chinensis]|uniref:peptidyl-tRNA hydrolase n=1 Tax=Ranatra chinensis TaxID=642074 RepID=A0ABD0YJC3_9HEMI
MVFVVNSSLEMTVGKIAAQVAHGALALYRELIRDQDQCINLTIWQDVGEKKIVLKGKDENHLLELEKVALSRKVPCVSIRDAGRTQIAPDSLTVLALFGSEPDVDQVTSSLRLL